MEPVPLSKAAIRHNVEKKPVRTEMIAAHRPAVRAAVRELGYGGVEVTSGNREADLAELRDKLAAATDDLERGVLLYAMGQLERFHEDCIEASKHWRAAKKLILDASQAPVDPRQREARRNQSFRFYGRTVVAEGMCALTNGRALGTDEVIRKGGVNLFGVPDVERAHVWFAMGMAMVETGDLEGGKALILQAARYARDPKLDQTIMTYAQAVGLTLP
jgi:predicted secreted protein